MPNDALSDAVKEAFATAEKGIVHLDTLEFSHPAVATLYLVKDKADHVFNLETGEPVTFVGTAIRFSLPTVGDNGIQELSIAVDNVDRRPVTFVKAVMGSSIPVTVKYRPYMSTDPTTPQMNPPILLYLRDIQITAKDVRGRASVADILNRSFPTENYIRSRFPSLGDG